MKNSLTLLIIVFGSLGALAQQTVDLQVSVSNLKNQNGKIRASLFAGEENYLKESLATVDTLVYNTSEIILVFKAVPVGEYAISIFHDENENGQMDTSLLGIPTEAYGFSNDAPSRFGPADYDEAKIRLVQGNATHNITLN